MALDKSKAADSDQNSYLHPQNIHRSFIPSNIVLKTLKPAPGSKFEMEMVTKKVWLKAVSPSPVTHTHTSHQEKSKSMLNISILSFTLEKIYTGVVKLKQNWHHNLKDEKSPTNLILVGNIESAVSWHE